MFKKKLITRSLMIMGLSIAMSSAFADPVGTLTIYNNTDFDSAVITNNTICSSRVIGSYGVTKAHSKNDIPHIELLIACAGYRHDCHADIYMTPDCSGTPIGSAVFDVDNGLKNVTVTNLDYKIDGATNGFSVTISGGPKKAA